MCLEVFTVIVKGISGTIFVFCTSQNMLINYSIIFLILALVYCHTKVIINQSNSFITSLLGFKKYNISLTYYVAIYTVCPYIHPNHPLTLPHDPSDTCHSQCHILFCFIFLLINFKFTESALKAIQKFIGAWGAY